MSKKNVIFKLKNNKGFILIELMLAIVIISVALVAISGMFTQAIQADVRAKDYTAAANLAQKQLELLKTLPPTYWAELPLPAVIPWIDSEQLPMARYKLTTNAMATAHNSLVQVIVTASWQDRGTECSIQIVTLYSAL